MTRISRIDDETTPVAPIATPKTEQIIQTDEIRGYKVETLESGAKRIQLEKVTATFRSPTGREAISVPKTKGAENGDHQNRLLAIACCTQWGDRKTVSLGELTSLRGKEHVAISQLLSGFMEPYDPEIAEGEDYSITITLSDGTRATFRDAKATDIDFIHSSLSKYAIEQDGQKIPSMESFLKIAGRLCTEFDGATSDLETAIEKRPAPDLIVIGRALLETFL